MKRFDSKELIAASIVLFIGILIGSFWLSGLAESISKLAATLGSLATAATLVFLIYQNIGLRKRQDSQQEQQDEIWAEQKEMLIFDKYQRHQNMFDTLLDSLETKHNHLFKFVDRIALYEQLFPYNSPTNCEYEINHSSTSFQCTSLSEALKITHAVTTIETSLSTPQLIHAIHELKECLNVNFVGHLEVGGFSSLNGSNIDVNLFQPLITIKILCDIVERLINFSSSYKTKGALVLSHLNYKVLTDIQKHIIKNESWAGELKHHQYNVVFKVAFLHLGNLSKVYNYLADQEKKSLLLLEDLFSMHSKVKEFLDSLNEPTTYVTQCINELTLLNNTQTESDFTDEIANYKIILEKYDN